MIGRNEKPFPEEEKQYYTDWLLQKDERVVYKLEDFFNFFDFLSFKILEVRIITKYFPGFPNIVMCLKNPLGENFELYDLQGNPATFKNPKGEIIKAQEGLCIHPITINKIDLE